LTTEGFLVALVGSTIKQTAVERHFTSMALAKVSGASQATLNPPRTVEEVRMQRTMALSPTTEALMRQVNEDLDWVAEHEGELLRRYEGELVVVHRREVIAHGDDEAELVRRAASPDHPRDELVVVEMLSAGFETSPDAVT